ncbi:TonB-dependent receptor [Nitrospirillum iridis]|uniref:Iron complex outermembrane receptor protein n=1 Tax=Nitrospirillum iridis TaxID=765888 RepID=A0A7X0EDS7_9PROT|nr:TonB-dependent receptor [Nitrospirillum iridis]MBB6253093.1 iron complex outermembrane receptor protein [Nitrospirillum iridis]
MNSGFKHQSSTLVLFAMLAMHGPALAADTAANEDQLEDITITAQRVGQRLQDVPVAVTALTGASLDRMAITTANDLGRIAPNVNFTSGSGGSTQLRPYIRGGGVSDGGNVTSESAVGIYVDDVYRARLSAAVMDFLDLDRVEVLRGPQGVLYGRNSSAGAVKLVTRAPEPDLAGFVEGGYGTWNERRLKGYVTDAISESGDWTASLNGMARGRDGGRQYDATLKKDVGAEEFQGLQADVAYKGDSPVHGRFSAFYTNLDSDGQYAISTNPYANGVESQISTLSGSYNTTLTPYPSYTHTRQYGTTVNVGADYDGGTVTSITGYSHLVNNWAQDFSGGVPASALGMTGGGYLALYIRDSKSNQHQISQELQAAGKAFGGFLDYVGGIYYFTESTSQDIQQSIFLAPSSQGYAVDTDSYAAFGQVTANLTDRLAVIAGGRYTMDQKHLSAYYNAAAIQRDDTFVRFTPKTGLTYKITADTLAYFTYSEGFKAGGYNGLAGSVAQINAPFRPEVTEAKEAGLKMELFDNRVKANLALFQNDVHDIQQLFNLADGTFLVDNFDARIRGLEAELSWRVAAGLTLWGNASFNDGTYTRGGGAATVNVQGKKVVNLPDTQFNIGADYTVSLNRGAVSVGADALFRSDVYSTIDNGAIGHVPGQSFLNAYVSYETGAWTYRLTGKNLLNQSGYVTGFGFSVIQPRFNLDPRTVLGTIRYTF